MDNFVTIGFIIKKKIEETKDIKLTNNADIEQIFSVSNCISENISPEMNKFIYEKDNFYKIHTEIPKKLSKPEDSVILKLTAEPLIYISESNKTKAFDWSFLSNLVKKPKKLQTKFLGYDIVGTWYGFPNHSPITCNEGFLNDPANINKFGLVNDLEKAQKLAFEFSTPQKGKGVEEGDYHIIGVYKVL